ncbi:alcohol dehydrogenase catalytic domain-containing protein [Amycolatopsis jejuensis]|uniref:alcohol dehydrogenase catalytic domain-containing protein n=1 Tax=Amycolatopsis jejuensis TaxID=330084 RepID=UPI0012E03605
MNDRKGVIAGRGGEARAPHISVADRVDRPDFHRDTVPAVEVGQRVAVLPTLTCGKCAGCRAGRLSECDELVIVGEHVDGTYAQYLAAPERNAIPIPDSVSHGQAAVSIVAYLTAWHLLRTRGQLVEGGNRARGRRVQRRGTAGESPGRCPISPTRS